ncbi:unnamed protein product (macronuclear) [Paramecium tetraurelia]|uniref:Phosphatidylinositol-3,4,5-trisphosphate 3-phosphatase n=1 Tax=Paramecium tetraurelia TaxID=5888 RepID=A0BN98_PARTE|nr:uncharacterized protein GSPATT00030653001 [Paramecium tetraurelia]CAK60015.1 unnamed protein product [Paramecium tetraurelia]|eukprot:XP_001427413.1 hypothetical protein (macronuclear) [Paramecium tetraurelia strain d4-2]
MDQESVFDLSSLSDFRSDQGLQQLYIVRGRSEQLQEQSKLVKEHLQSLNNEINGGFTNPLKSLVSKQKNRFIMDGFDLDLTYITEQVIAMGFPAIDYEAIYRNSMEDVQRFFNQRHKNHYKIINLCSERKYDHAYFDGNVSEYPFDDHQAPQFNMIYELCAEIHNYVTQDKQNVVAIHCKAGKGRTGIMICCYLLFSELFKSSFEAMRYYGMMRTKNNKGVTIPSQIRYILYFEKALQMGYTVQDVPQPKIQILQIRLITIPSMNYSNSCTPYILIQNYQNQATFTKFQIVNDSFILFTVDIIVEKDTRIICYNKTLMGKEVMFQFWFHTGFIESNGLLVIDKYMLDRAVKDKKHKIFSPNFRVEVQTITLPN